YEALTLGLSFEDTRSDRTRYASYRNPTMVVSPPLTVSSHCTSTAPSGCRRSPSSAKELDRAALASPVAPKGIVRRGVGVKSTCASPPYRRPTVPRESGRGFPNSSRG